MSDKPPSGGPLTHRNNPEWDHPLRLLEAIKLWSREFARRLDQVQWRSADEVRIVSQERQRHRMQHDRLTKESDHHAGDSCTSDVTPEAAIGAVNPEIPDFLRNDLVRLLRDWDKWDDDDRLVGRGFDSIYACSLWLMRCRGKQWRPTMIISDPKNTSRSKSSTNDI